MSPSGLAKGIVGPARVIAFGTSIVAPVIFLFPLWGIIHPSAYTLVNLLPFTALGWLALGIIAVSVLRARRPASFQALGTAFLPDEGQPAKGGSRH